MADNEIKPAPAPAAPDRAEIPDWRNPRHNARGGVDVDVNLPALGWVPYTLDAGDLSAPFDVAAVLVEVGGGAVAPYVAPEPADVEVVLSPARFVWLLTYTGLDAHWSALEAAAEGAGDREGLAYLRAQRSRSVYRKSHVVEALERFAAPLAALGLEPVDFAELEIAWTLAAEVAL